MSPDDRRRDESGRRRPEPERQGTRAARARPDARRSGGAERTDRDLGGDQVEGFHAVRELLVARRRRVREVWVVDRAGGSEELARLASAAGVRVRTVGGVQLEERARSEAPQGVIAFATPIASVAVDELINAPDAFLVVIDGITDPGNLGAILRTAETAGATGIVLTRHRGARLGPTALKAAAGAAEYVPIAAVAGVPGFLDQARRAGVWTVGLDGDGTADVGDLAVADAPVAIVLGAEGRGLARLTRERCDVLAAIPMYGRLASLNVSAAAAIALHAVARRRQPDGPETRL